MSEAWLPVPGQGYRKGLPLHLLGCNLATARDAIPVPRQDSTIRFDRRSMMATDVILPALGMSQETGKIVQWLKAEGEQVAKGEPLAEIETDKATVEIEAPADGVLAHVSATAGDDVPVGRVIASILAPEEVSPGDVAATPPQAVEPAHQPAVAASPLASRIAAEHNLDLNRVKSAGRRIQKGDGLA